MKDSDPPSVGKKAGEETKEWVVRYNPFFTSSAAAKRMVEPAGGKPREVFQRLVLEAAGR